MSQDAKKQIVEKEIKGAPGILMLLFSIFMVLVSIFVLIIGCIIVTFSAWGVPFIILGIVMGIFSFSLFAGLHVVNPNEALVLTLFGRYYGTIKTPGYFFVNPFAAAFNPGMEKVVQTDSKGNTIVSTTGSKKISTKVHTLDNGTQKVNDILGNPIIIGAIVIWKVNDPTKAVFMVENYKSFLSTQCDSIVRNTARLYPYDDLDDNEDDGHEEKTLRGSSQEIAEKMKEELQEKVSFAGLEIIEVRITHLSYSEEIAAAMLQRQQAVAVIAARQKIVEGAVSMVEMAINQLNENEIVVLDDERKAQMVSNLLVVLCGNKDAQPIVNSGSIY